MSLMGRWRIVAMEAFDDDYPDLAEPAFIEIDERGIGEMAFGASLPPSTAPIRRAASTSPGTASTRAIRSAATVGANFSPTARSSAKYPGETATKPASKLSPGRLLQQPARL